VLFAVQAVGHRGSRPTAARPLVGASTRDPHASRNGVDSVERLQSIPGRGSGGSAAPRIWRRSYRLPGVNRPTTSQFCPNENAAMVDRRSDPALDAFVELGARPPEIDAHLFGRHQSRPLEEVHVFWWDFRAPTGTMAACRSDPSSARSGTRAHSFFLDLMQEVVMVGPRRRRGGCRPISRKTGSRSPDTTPPGIQGPPLLHDLENSGSPPRTRLARRQGCGARRSAENPPLRRNGAVYAALKPATGRDTPDPTRYSARSTKDGALRPSNSSASGHDLCRRIAPRGAGCLG